METKELALEVFERVVAREVLPHGLTKNSVIDPGEYILIRVENPIDATQMDWLVLRDQRAVGGAIGWWRDRIRDGEVEIPGI